MKAGSQYQHGLWTLHSASSCSKPSLDIQVLLHSLLSLLLAVSSFHVL